MSDYGDDISVAESVASLFQEERELEDKQKRLYKEDNVEEEKLTETLSIKNKYEIYDKFKEAVFQDASNNKLYILKIKKSQDNINVERKCEHENFQSDVYVKDK